MADLILYFQALIEQVEANSTLIILFLVVLTIVLFISFIVGRVFTGSFSEQYDGAQKFCEDFIYNNSKIKELLGTINSIEKKYSREYSQDLRGFHYNIYGTSMRGEIEFLVDARIGTLDFRITEAWLSAENGEKIDCLKEI